MNRNQSSFFHLILFIIILFGTSFSDWVMQNPPLVGSPLDGITMKKDGSIWMVGFHSEIISSVDGGLSWRKYLRQSGNRLYSICFDEDGRGWAVGGTYGRPYSLISEDGGQTWIPIDLPDDFINFTKVCCSKIGDIWIFGEFYAADSSVNGDALIFPKGSTTWKRISFEKNTRIRDITFVSDSVILAVGGGGYIGKSLNYGKDWQKISTEKEKNHDDNIIKFYSDIIMLDKDTGYIINYFGQILKTIDGGNTWNISFQEKSAHLRCIDFKNEKIGLVFANYISYSSFGMSRIYFTQDGGEHWNLGLVKTSSLIDDFIFLTERSGIACASNGSIYKIDIIDSKTLTCEELTKNTGWSMRYIDGYNDSCLIAAPFEDSTILTTTSGGNHWEVVEVPCEQSKKVFYFDSANITLVGKSGQLYYKSGSTWVEGDSLGRPFSGSKKGDCAILTNSKRHSFLTENAGKDWKKMDITTFDGDLVSNSFIYDINNIWVFTKKGKIAFTSNKGESWSEIHPDIFQGEGGLSSMLFISEKIGFIGGKGPKKSSLLFKTTDGGHSWVQKNRFTFIPNDHTYINVRLNRGVNRIVSGNNKDIWFTTMLEVFHSSDSGETWVSQKYPQYVTALSDIYCSESGDCWIAGNNWTIFHYQMKSIHFDHVIFPISKPKRPFKNQLKFQSYYDLLGRFIPSKTLSNKLLITKSQAIVKKEILIR